MRMCVRPDISRRQRHARKARPGEAAEGGGERGRGVDSVTGVTVVEIGVPTRERGDEGWRSEQGTVRLSGFDLDSRWRAWQIVEVEGVGGEAAAGRCRYR